MSSIFNLLDGISEHNKNQAIKSVVPQKFKQSRDITSNTVHSSKTMGGSKPKGLSMRSSSDINVSYNVQPANLKANTSGKKMDHLKVIQVDKNGCLLSPERQDLTKKFVAQELKYTSAKEKAKVTDKCVKTQKMLNDSVFKKPSLLNKSIDKLPEPEKLASYHNAQLAFDYEHIFSMEKDWALHVKDKENLARCKKEKVVPEIPEMEAPTWLRPMDAPSFIPCNFWEGDNIGRSPPQMTEWPVIFDDDDEALQY